MRKTVHRNLAITIFVLLLGGSLGRASPFDLMYDGNSFPEDEGWVRRTWDPNGEVQRSLQDGVFTLDTRASMEIADYYLLADPALAPGPDEQLRVSWRMHTTGGEMYPPHSGVSVFVENADRQYATIEIGIDFVSEGGALHVPPQFVAIEPLVWHDYTLVTDGSDTYQFYIDEQLAFNSWFYDSAYDPGPVIAWGDSWLGLTNPLSEWDYVEVSVVPESSSVIVLLTLLLSSRWR